jgi:subtilisin family serine protease
MFLFCRLTGWLKNHPFLLLLPLLLAIVLLVSLQAGLSSAAGEERPFEVVTLPPEARAAPFGLDSRARGLTGEQAKMDGMLARLANEGLRTDRGGQDAVLDSDLRFMDGRVQVRVLSTADQLAKAEMAVKAAGGVVTTVSDLGPELQAWIPVAELENVAAEAAVTYISQPAYVVPLDDDDTSATSEGVAALNANEWHAKGKRGAGVKIALIDGGFLGYSDLLGSNLPANVTVKNFVDGQSDNDVGSGPSRHGTACSEIVYDVAPDAQFYLIKIATNIDLQQAVNYAIGQGVDVISTSVGWYNLTPGDGTGQFADLANLARNNGIIWLTAAGNDREAHWGGQFYDPDGDGFHNFDGVQEINYFGPGNSTDAYLIPSGVLLRAYVRWDDWAAANQDYDLLVVAWSNNGWQIVGSSTRPQSGGFGQRPTEDVVGVTQGSARPYGFVIERINSNRSVNFELFAPDVARLDEIVQARSLPNLADAGAVVTVGAVNALSPYSFESYSAQGPTNGPGGTSFGGFTKPNLTAYSGVSTEAYGFRAFAGTSASAPHAAGAAALIKGAYPSYSPQQVQDVLQQRAIDMGAPGMDTQFGYGRAFLGDPPSSLVGLNNHAFLPVAIGNP